MKVGDTILIEFTVDNVVGSDLEVSTCVGDDEVALVVSDDYPTEGSIRQSERAKVEAEIVAWLRRDMLCFHPFGDIALEAIKQQADFVEQGEHRVYASTRAVGEK